MLELINVSKKYVATSGETLAMDSISIKFPDKGLIFITGKSGSGKTTLLNVVGGLDNFDDGEIIINGKKFSSFTQDEYDSYRNTFVGFIFQDYNLLPEYSLEKNIKIANELQGKVTSTNTIVEYLEKFNIAGLQGRKPNEISGGQKQRAAIVRSLLKDPQIIMADEPTGALDSVTGIQVMETLKELAKEKLVIVISHDLELAEKYADRIIKLIDGKIVDDVTLVDRTVEGNVYEDDNSITVKAGSTLTEEENKALLKAIEQKKSLNSVENITVRQRCKTDTDVKSDNTNNNIELVKSKMKFSSVAGFGVKSLGAKPGRLILTIILSVIAFSVFCLFDTVAAYSNARLVKNLLNSSDYKAISLSNNYYSDNYNGETLRLSQEDIDEYSKKFGYDFRPVYDLNDKDFSSANGDGIIENLKENSGLTLGEMYYYNYFTGYVEFKDNELKKDDSGKVLVIDESGFNLTLVEGNFPKVEYDSSNKATKNSLKNIAISTYMADAIIYWRNDGTTQKSLIGKRFKILGNEYVIYGIYDCGKIPSKYDELKTEEYVNKDDPLANELRTYLNSGLFLNILVPEGYCEALMGSKLRVASTYSGKTTYKHILEGKDYHPYSATISDYSKFYNVKDLAVENIMFIDEDRENALVSGKGYELKDDEVLIHLDTTRFVDVLYEKQIKEYRNLNIPDNDNYNSSLPNTDENNTRLQRLIFPYNYYFDKREVPLTETQRSAFKEYMAILKGIFESNGEGDKYIRELDLNIIKEGVTTSNKKYKIVGFYIGVNNDYVVTNNNIFPLAMSSKALEDIGIYSNQGVYGRMIAPLKENKKGAKLLSKAMSANSGVKLTWFNNSALETMEYNAETIGLLSKLFLYVSLALMAFSVFMLFNYISTSIASKKKSIGVLRALGSSGKNIFMMFLTESFIISMINAVVSCIVAYVSCFGLNYYIKNVMNLVVDFAVFGIRQILIVVGVSLCTAVASSLFPIIKISKEKPVNLIKDL